MGIITKSELRQNYCITGDKLRRFTLTITAAPLSEAYVRRRSDRASVRRRRRSLPFVGLNVSPTLKGRRE